MICNQQVLEALKINFEKAITNAEETFGMLTITVDKSYYHEMILWLKNDKTMKFHFLTDLCGLHHPDNKGKELGVTVHLQSMTENTRIRIKTYCSEQQSSFASLTDIYDAANWMERETFDFFGIKFEKHPDLRRILNVDEMTYYPLLKQYPLEDQTRTDKQDEYFGR
jgi:NADH-quinone oxidoreductase subunit C